MSASLSEAPASGWRACARRSAALAILPWLSWLALPPNATPILYPDSFAYLGWPADYRLPDGVWVMGRRSAAYPLLLGGVGQGLGLLYAQGLLSMASWTLLGWSIARGVVGPGEKHRSLASLAGAIGGGLLCLSPMIWQWNSIVLPESLGLSLLALMTTLTLRLASSHRDQAIHPVWKERGTYVAWILAAIALGFTRDNLLYALPFFAAPLFAGGFRRGVMGLVVAGGILALGSLDARTNHRADWGIGNVLTRRLLPDPSAKKWLLDRGMPDSATLDIVSGRAGARTKIRLQRDAPDWMAWLRADGLPIYQRYLLMHPSTWLDAMNALQQARRPSVDYAPGLERRWPQELGEKLYLVLPPLEWWAVFVFLLPLSSPCAPLPLCTMALALAALGQAYLGYHADSTEIERHMLSAAILQRISFWMSLGVLGLHSKKWLRSLLRSP